MIGFLDISFSLPFKEPVLVFALILFIILISPLLFKKLHMPGIIGLILAGVLIGPHGFNLLQRNSSIVLLGTVGLLYIMFLAGLEIDLNDFKKNRNRSLAFGALTFFIPIIIGTLASYHLLHFSWTSSILLASMFSTHTLVAYPIISKLGITKKEAVTITIGGTIITDTAVLVVLAIITGSATGGLNLAFGFKLGLSLAVFAFVVLWGMPRISRWFFKNIEGESVSQYIFVLAIVFTSAFLAELAGVEPIIGAFLAGLALNRLIPHTSALMNRIEFVGNAIFIPFFLISVGMLVDYRVLLQGPEALIVTAVVIVVTFGGKWLAAFITQKLFNYSSTERKLIFGLSSAHAAATLAVVLIGYDLGLLNENVLNATILLILITCMVSSFVVESSGRKLAIAYSQLTPETISVSNRILVPISNPVTIENLIDFAILIKDPKSTHPIYPLAVVKDAEDTSAQLVATNKMLEKAILHASATDNAVQLVSRIDVNIADGMIRAIRELMITDVVIGWNGKITTRERIFGTVLDNLLVRTQQMIMVCRIIHPLNTTGRLHIAVPPNAELENGFAKWMDNMKTIARQLGAAICFYGSGKTLNSLQGYIAAQKQSLSIDYHTFDNWDNISYLADNGRPDDLYIFVSARSKTLSYTSFLDKLPKQLARSYKDHSFVVVYPEQKSDLPASSIINV
jgi:Kef-type K+ transport system membrane component KefB